ncbi:MAG: dihydrolipoyl dehydrogenase [Candidatus Firestonebacteria bacterium]
MEYDIAVIGSGPGGYVSAIRAAQLGAKVVVIEKGDIGGVCVNEGCIPTKTLVASAEFYNKLTKAKEFGIDVKEFKIDFPTVIQRKERIIRRLQLGINSLFKSYNIEIIKGEARFLNKNQLEVIGDLKNQKVEFKHCIIATGSKSGTLPDIKPDGNIILSTSDMLSVEQIPASLLIIGGGVIGVEFASLFNRLGSKVTIVEILPRILINEDEEISLIITNMLKKRGVEILTNSKVVPRAGAWIEGNDIEIEKPDGKSKMQIEKVLVCVGRIPVYENLGLENAGVFYDKNGIKVNDRMETNIGGVYAIGDVTGKYFLAYVSSAEGIVAAENACGLDSKIDYKIIPKSIFTSPEIGSIGLTETEAKDKGCSVKIGRFPFFANGRAVISGETEGIVKVIVDKNTNHILGVHIIGPEATELIHIAAMAMKANLKVEEFQRILFSHPTLSETILESVHDADKKAIDLPNKS